MQIEQNQTNFNSENIRKEKTALMEMSDLFKGNIVNAINSICT